jgi:putative transposase
MSPRVACKNRWRRIEALGRNKAFLDRYNTCRGSLLAKICLPFPLGTYWLPRFAAVPCESPPILS